MIIFADKYIVDFCEWLQFWAPAPDVKISILHGFDAISSEHGDGFAAYNPQSNVILCADPNAMQEALELSNDDAIDTVLTNIAHEYRHHMQCYDDGIQTKGEDELEVDAEDFALAALQTYKNQHTIIW